MKIINPNSCDITNSKFTSLFKKRIVFSLKNRLDDEYSNIILTHTENDTYYVGLCLKKNYELDDNLITKLKHVKIVIEIIAEQNIQRKR